jgi:hypothetical protein
MPEDPATKSVFLAEATTSSPFYFPADREAPTKANARLTRRFGAAKRRKIGRCAADCYSFYGQSSMKKSVSTFLTSYTAAELTPTP